MAKHKTTLSKKVWSEISKLNGGKGGWYCSCCNVFQCSPRNMKKRANRMIRRANRQQLAISPD